MDDNHRLPRSDYTTSRENDADKMLEAALASYVAQAPRAGFEQRVLARISSEERERRKHPWTWQLGLALSACVALLLSVAPHEFSKHRTALPAAHTATPRSPGSPLAGAAMQVEDASGSQRIALVHASRHLRNRQLPIAEQRLPGLQAYLLAAPSPQEKTLLMLGQRSLGEMASHTTLTEVQEISIDRIRPVQTATLSTTEPFHY